MSLLELRDVEVSRGGRPIWSGAIFSIEPGSVTAVLGPNGSGKSTLLHAISGLLPVSGGELLIFGEHPHRGNSQVGYVAQTRVADATSTLTGRDYVGLGMDGVRYGWGRTKGKRDAVTQALRQVGATGFADRPMHSLSGGQRQRIALAHATVFKPKLLLLDEPLAALDIAAQAEIVDLINLLRVEQDMAIVVVAHDLNPLSSIVDQVVWIARRQVKSGTIDEVVNESVLSELYGHPIEILVTPSGRRVIVGLEEEFAHPHPHGHDHSGEEGHQHFAELYEEGRQ